jgi:hypothetical protein
MADINAVKEITAKLEDGVKELFNSEKYAAYLKTMSRFHNYSTRNTLLIYMQYPNASKVGSYLFWKNNFNRQVKKGEHGIKIFAPVPHKETKEFEKLDPVTNRPIIGDDGQPVMETLPRLGVSFKTVNVFAYEQTTGEPLPELIEPLSGDVEHYELFMDALRKVSPLPIVFEDLPSDTDGLCYFGEKIAIRSGMSQVQTVSAVIHEITHATIHDRELNPDVEKQDRYTLEVQAESCSYAVAAYFNIETGANSFSYIGSYCHSREPKELQESLDVIRKTAAGLIERIDKEYRALANERDIDLTVHPSVLTTSEQTSEKTAIEETARDFDGTAPDEQSADKPRYRDEEEAAGGDQSDREDRDEYGNWDGDPVPYYRRRSEKNQTATDLRFPDPTKEHTENELLLPHSDIEPTGFDLSPPAPAMKPTEHEIQPPDPKMEQIDHDLFLPDLSIDQTEMFDYGYTESDMYPLSSGKAVELFDTDHPIYLLYPDNTEALALDKDEIITFGGDGLCGITKADWEISPIYKAQVALKETIPAHSQASTESDLLNNHPGMFGIYQLKDSPELRNNRFSNSKEMKQLGLRVEHENYNLVYTAPLLSSDTQINLNKIFQDFNIDRPDDFKGHSLSVSDVIVLQWNGEVSAHFVDSIGFMELSHFTGNEREQKLTLSEQEAIANISKETANTQQSSLHSHTTTNQTAANLIVVGEVATDQTTTSQADASQEPAIQIAVSQAVARNSTANQTATSQTTASNTATSKQQPFPKSKPSLLHRLETNKQIIAQQKAMKSPQIERRATDEQNAPTQQ